MKEKERRIISHLRKDARTSLAAISSDTEIPISTIYDKINRLKGNDVIKSFTTLVDFEKLGYHHQSKVAFKLTPNQKNDFLNFVKEQKCINSIYEINGGFDFMIEMVHRNVKEHADFMDSLDEAFDLLELQEFQLINEIAREKFA